MVYGLTALGVLVALLVWISPRRRQRRQLRKVSGFGASVIYAGGRGRRALAINPDTAQFAVTNRWRRPTVYSYIDIIAVEVLRNGDAVTTTDRGSQVAGAAVGALLLGPMGLLLGGLTGRTKQSQKVNSLTLRIVTRDMKAPVVDVPFLELKAPGLDVSSKRLQRAATLVAEWHGRFLSAMREASGGANAQRHALYSPQG